MRPLDHPSAGARDHFMEFEGVIPWQNGEKMSFFKNAGCPLSPPPNLLSKVPFS
jgi:hypothetical protein